MKPSFFLLTAVVFAGSIVMAQTQPGSSAVMTPVQTGCSAGSEVLSVSELTGLGYRVPLRVDGAGNNNGIVCGKVINPVSVEARNFCGGPCPVPIIYKFRDDDLKAQQISVMERLP